MYQHLQDTVVSTGLALQTYMTPMSASEERVRATGLASVYDPTGDDIPVEELDDRAAKLAGQQEATAAALQFLGNGDASSARWAVCSAELPRALHKCPVPWPHLQWGLAHQDPL